MQDRLEQLEEIARAASDAMISVDELLESAGTSATDALRRVEIQLMAARFQPLIGTNLDFRGFILDELECMGLRYDCRDDKPHFLYCGRGALLCWRPAAGRLPGNLSGCKKGLAGHRSRPTVVRPGGEKEGRRRAVTELVRRKRRLVGRKRRLVLETPYRIRGRALIVHVEAAGLRIREKGRRAGALGITWAQVYNRAAEIAADRARQQAREGKKGR